MTVVLESRRDFNLENFRRVAVEGEGVQIGERARRAMAEARRSFMALLESDRTAFIYGTTSGGGTMAKIPVPPEEQRERAQRTGRRLGQGSGFGSDHLPERVVRGIVFARLANFVEGNAKTRPEIAERVAAMLDGPMPRVPMDGQVGAGEILPLAHIVSALPPGDYEEGEPMALVNGSPCSAALVADTALHARNRLELAEKVFALSIEAFNAPLDAYDAVLEVLWGDEHEAMSLRRLRRHLQGVPTEGRRPYPAPVSYRILPRVLGQARRAVAAVERAAEVSLASVTDNPVYLPPTDEHPLGRVFSNGGYHNAMAYPAMDTLAAAWADLCTLADRHTTKLHDSAISLLPHLLVRPGSIGWGTGAFGLVQVGFGEAARHAAQRTFLPPSEGGGFGQNDVASPTFLAYAKERRAAWCLDASMAVLALVASQAFWVTDRQPPPPLRELLEGVRSYFPPLDDTRRRRPGEQAGRLAEAFAAVALTGRFEPRAHRARARRTGLGEAAR